MTGTLGRVAQDLVAEAQVFGSSHRLARIALCASLGGVGAVLVALTLHLDQPWWAAISAVSVLQAEASATLTRSIERMIGTVLGALVGYLLAPLVAWHLAFEIACAGIVAFTVYGQDRTVRSYAVLMFGVTALLVLFGTLSAPSQALYLAADRSLEVLTGIVVGGLVTYALHPVQGARPPAAHTPGILSRPVDADLLGIAVEGGIAVAVIPAVWTAFELPGLSQTPITAFVVMTAMRGDPRLKALTRALGCLMGGLFGIASVGLVGDAVLPWLACLSLGLYLAASLQHGGGDAAYAGHQAAIAVILVMVQGPAATPDLTPAIDRLAGIVGGIGVVWAVTALLGPLRRSFVRVFDPPLRSTKRSGGPRRET